ncbi:MAG: hypothetical protein ACJAV6_000670 [Candidatus Paceibacteria bacterium]|jgi:hypothetical protein
MAAFSLSRDYKIDNNPNHNKEPNNNFKILIFIIFIISVLNLIM